MQKESELSSDHILAILDEIADNYYSVPNSYLKIWKKVLEERNISIPTKIEFFIKLEKECQIKSKRK